MDEQKALHSAEFIFAPARRFWWNYDFLELMSRRWRLDRVTRALDVGCGVGHWTAVLATYLPPEAEVVGIDREEQWIQVAMTAARDNPSLSSRRFQQGLAESLPFSDESFDMVSCQTLLIHLKDPLKALNEMRRVLKPGGLLAVVEPNNIVQTLLATSLTATDKLCTVLARVRFQVMCEQGKEALGEGRFSIGDMVPGMVASLGFKSIEVFQSDKTLPFFPPYDTDEQATLTKTIFGEAFRPDTWVLCPSDAKRYFLAAGGTAEEFSLLWAEIESHNSGERDAIRRQAFHRAGGRTMYLVSGRK